MTTFSQSNILKSIKGDASASPFFRTILRKGVDLMYYGENFGQVLKTKWLGKNYNYLETVDSTNSYAKMLREKRSGQLVFADIQTNGKGSHERKWVSDQNDGIWATLILNDKKKLGYGIVTLLMAYSIVTVLRKQYGINAMIKWPNDVYVNYRKVAGILMELSEDKMILGFRINVNTKDFTEEIQDIATSFYREMNKKYDRGIVLAYICKEFENYYDSFLENNQKVAIWIQRKANKWLLFRNELVLIEKGKKKKQVLLIGMNEEGYLMIKDEQGEVQLEKAGEIRVKIPQNKIEKVIE